MRLDEVRGKYKIELESETAVDIAREDYLTYFTLYDNPPIYRGVFRGSGNVNFDTVQVAYPSKVGRVSANTSNEYTVLMSGLPSWKNYPKRSHSFICSTSYETAMTYASTKAGLYAVVLPESFRLGVCADGDIWESFLYMNEQLGIEIVDSAGDAFNYMITKITGFDADRNTTIYDLQSAFQKFQDFVMERNRDLSDTPYADNRLAQYIAARLRKNAPQGQAFQILAKLVEPTINGFELVTNVRNLATLPEDAEVWTDSECLLVKAVYYQEFRKKVLG